MQQTKISIRPQIPTALVNENMTIEEKFQNTTLRPVIKMQHDLLFMRLESELNQAAFQDLTKDAKKQFIQNVLFKGNAIRSEVVGLITGCFTLDEYGFYRENAKTMNKRIIQIIIKRVINTLGL
jgi:hypothetical protein